MKIRLYKNFASLFSEGFSEQEYSRSNDQGGFIRSSCDFARHESPSDSNNTQGERAYRWKIVLFSLKVTNYATL